MEGEFLLDALLEFQPLLESQGIGLGDDRNDIDNVGKLLQDDDVDGLQRVTGRLDEEQAAVDPGVLDIALALRSKFLPKVGGVLILDVLDDGIPATVVVNQITVAWGVDNVQSQTHTVLLDDVGNRVNLGSRADGLIGKKSTLGIDKVRREDGVDQSRLSETGLACGIEESDALVRCVGLMMRGRAVNGDGDDDENNQTNNQLIN